MMYASTTHWIDAPRALPEGRSLYVIGDVHGCADELVAMQQHLRAAIAHHPDRVATIVHAGDYIDRGPDILRTLDALLEEGRRDDGIERVHLVGNHEQFLIELIGGDAALSRDFVVAWYDNGGEYTMRELAVPGYGRLLDSGDVHELGRRAAQALGPERVAWLLGLSPMHRVGDYVCVHAGIDPAVDLDAQDFTDLLLIREPFLAGKGWTHPFCVVHGHSISMPVVKPHRIGVDAGCWRRGVLCAVQIEGRRLRFHGVACDRELLRPERLNGTNGDWRWTDAEPVR